jgi:uncharacterized membrane protein YfcA
VAPSTLRLVAIGVAAGLFSALFGVGGGTIIVPLLVLLLAFDQRVASATSLAAIGVIALSGVVLYGSRGEVHVGAALLVGLPAAVGAVFGAVMQQRLPTRTLALAFAVLIAIIGVRLIVV